MYPQALSDIEKAMSLEPKEPLYYVEAAALNYRIGQLDDTIEYAKKAIAIDDKFPDAYRIIVSATIRKAIRPRPRNSYKRPSTWVTP